MGRNSDTIWRQPYLDDLLYEHMYDFKNCINNWFVDNFKWSIFVLANMIKTWDVIRTQSDDNHI